jgi:hypothetical protein
MIFKDTNIKRELLGTVASPGMTRNEELLQSFYANLLEVDVSIHKLESITKDGAPAMTSENVGLICLCNKYCGVFAPCKNC